MNSSAQPPRPAGGRRASFCLMLCLLPLAVHADQSCADENRNNVPSRPYLATLGAPGLRFSEALPSPDLSVRHPPSAPTPPVPSSDSAPAAKPEPTASTAESSSPPPPEVAASPAKQPAQPVPNILPDETRPKVRPEDFLPYFQFPANGANPGNATVLVPGSLTPATPSPQPLSTATYRQQ